MSRMAGVSTAVALAIIVPTAVLATHPDPGPKAKKIKGDLVMAYEPCTSPDTALDGYPTFAGCSTAVRSDPTCGFGEKGQGQFKVRATPTNLKVSFKLKGLDAGCEGSILGIVFRSRVTGDDCGGATCTLDETTFMPGFGACTVTGGACTVSSSGPSILPAGGRSGIEILGVDILRDNTSHPFRMGFVIP